jgi:hypothetical protein
VAANKDAPAGFRPVTGGVAGTTPQMNEYTVASSVTIYQGEPVCLVSGVVNVFNSTNRLKFLGVAAHPIKVADTIRTIRIYDDPEQQFIAQFDSDSALITTDAGLKAINFSIINVDSGNGTTMQSIAEINSDPAYVTNNSTTLAVVIGKKFSSRIEDDQTISWGEAIVEFNINNHVFGTDLAAT